MAGRTDVDERVSSLFNIADVHPELGASDTYLWPALQMFGQGQQRLVGGPALGRIQRMLFHIVSAQGSNDFNHQVVVATSRQQWHSQAADLQELPQLQPFRRQAVRDPRTPLPGAAGRRASCRRCRPSMRGGR